MTKRATALMLAVMMVFSIMPNIALAEGIELGSSVSVSSIATESSDTVDYVVTIPEGSTIAALDFTISYDTDELILVSSEKYGQFFSYINTNTAGSIEYSAADVAAFPAADICKITFKANDDLIADCTASISAEVTAAADANDDDVTGVSIPTKNVDITVTNPAKFEVTSKKILVGGEHTEGTISFEAVRLSGLTASDISATEDSGALEFGTPTIEESGCGSIPFTVKSGAEAGHEVEVTVKAGDFSDKCTVFVDKPAVAGDLNVGSTLTATSLLDGATFKWIVILGEGADMQHHERATGSSYTLTEADKGGVLKLEVSHSDYEGMDYVYANPILAAKPAAPKLECASKTYDSITLTAVEGAEYKCGDGAWQDSPTFTGLKVGTGYVFSIRIKAKGDTPASDVVEGEFFTKSYEAQQVTVIVKDKAGNTVPSNHYTVYEYPLGEEKILFDGKLTSDEKVDISIELTEEGKKLYKAASADKFDWTFDGLKYAIYSQSAHIYRADISLEDRTKGGSTTLTLTPKAPFEVRVKQGGQGGDYTFEAMQAGKLTVSMPYTGNWVCYTKSRELGISFNDSHTGKSNYFLICSNSTKDPADTYWVDAEGNEIPGNPVNVGTYKLMACFDGNAESDFKPLAPKVIVELTVTKADRIDVPKKPTLVKKTENSLTVENRDADGNLETGVEWMLCDSGKNPITDWMKGENGQVTFTGLTDGTRYVVVARYAESANQSASGACTEPLQVDTVYAPKTIKIFSYVNDPSEYLSGLFKVYLADENDKPTDAEVTTLTAGASNAKRVVIMLTEEARERYYLDGYPGENPIRYETAMEGTDLTPLNEYSFATTITGFDNGLYLPPDDEKQPSMNIKLFEKKENSFLVSKNGAAAAAAPVVESIPYTGSAFIAQGALQADAGAAFTVIPSISDTSTGKPIPSVCWKDANGDVVANPVAVGTYYLYASVAAGTMWKATPETLVLTLTVDKGEQTAPASAPEKVSATKDSVTVKLADAKKVQFAIDDGTGSLIWYDAASDGTYTFTGLDDYTKYNVVARYAANDNQLASPAGTALAVQTEPAPQIIEVKVKCGDTELAPADFKIYEGSEFFDWAITGGEKVTITVKLSDAAKKIYKPNQLTVDAHNMGSENISYADGTYTATLFLTDYTEGGTVTFNLTEKETISVRVSKEQAAFSEMQTSLTDIKTYDGKASKWLDITYSNYEGSMEFAYFIKEDKNGLYLDTEWYDAQGKELSDDPVNVGTYKLITKYKGNDNYKPLAETLLVTLTINPAVMETPDAPTVGEVTKDSVSYTGVKGQKYAVTTSATAPDANAADWKECTADGTMTETGLEPNTQYYIHTFVPALTSNHANSAAATTSVTTKHSYGVEVAEETTLTWNVRIGTDPASLSAIMNQTVPVKSTGTGDISVECTNSAESPFGTGVTSMLIKQSDPEKVLPFTLKNNMISTAAAGSVSYTYTYTVKENDTDGAEIKSFKVTCVVNVVEKDVVSFTNFDDLTVTYGEAYDMETAKPQVQTGVAPYTGELEYSYTDKNGVTGTGAPLTAGTYTVKVKVPDSNADYAGEKSVKLTINPKEVELTGLTVKEKIYDGTPAAELDETGASLAGVVPGDSLSFYVTSAAFNSANVDEANAVTVAVELAGSGKDNYTLKALAPIAAAIKPREVSITVTAADKVYDGTIDAEVTAAYAENSGMLDADQPFVTLNAEGAFDNKNVGEDKKVICTVSLENNTGYSVASNYTVKYEDATASISEKEVYVVFEGTMEHVYDGQPKSVTAKVEGVEAGDEASVTVVYGTDTAAPTLAGAYVLTAKDLTNSNYKLAAEPYTQAEAARTLKIALGEYTPGSSSAEKSIGYLDTAEKSYDLKEIFGVALDGTFEVFLLEENDILAKHELVSGNALVQLKGDCSIGQTANITYVFTPAAANTYKTFTVKLTVKVAAESVKSIEIIGAPDEIEIGTELDLSAIELKVTYENGSVDVFDSTTYTASGYSTELKVENLGTQTLTLTALKNGATHTATKNITVKDALAGLSMETAPTKTEYALGATEIDLAGGKVKAAYKSGAEKSMDLTDPALTLSEVTEAMMRTLGEHAVAVSYTEGSTFQTAFTFTVVTGSVENPGEGQTGGTVKDDDEFLTDPDDENSTVPGSDVNVTIGAAQDPDGAKEAVEAENPGLKDKTLPLGAKLEDASGNKVYSKQPIAVQVAYPAGTDSKDTFIVYLVNEDGSTTSITPTKEDKHLSFELPAGFSEGDFVIAWKKYVKPTNKDEYDEESGSFEKRQRNFWKNVRNLMRDAKEGSVLTIGAGDYDQMPTFIMDAVKEYNVGLRIRWNGGEEILLAPENALTPEKNRLYYPLSYLEKNLGKVQLGAGGSIILAPQTGDDRPVTDYNMGFFTMPGAVAESVDNANGEVALTAANGSMNGAPILMLLGSTAALAAGWFVSNRRREEEN